MNNPTPGSIWPTQPVPPPAGPQSGMTRLGRYDLRQQLGAGGMGVVHLATDPAGRAVAVKELPAHIAGDETARARLRREFAAMRRVDHPRVAAVLDADLDGPRPYIVTRYVPGRSLEDRVRDGGPLQPGQLRQLGRGLAQALQAIHSAGVVHRDLKPTNVLMLGDDPVVIDFGIAQAADDVRLTQSGVVMGTPGFLAPEVLDGAAAGPGVDWWAWAATMAYAATGRPPFGRGPLDAVLARVHRGEPDLDQVPGPLAAVLRAELNPEPRQRPRPGQLIGSLDDWEAGRPVFAQASPGLAPTARVPARPGPAPTERVPQVPPAAPATERLGAAGATGGPAAATAASPTQAQPRWSTRLMPARLRAEQHRADSAAAGSRHPVPAYATFGAAAPADPSAGLPAPAGGRAEQPARRASVTFPLFALLLLTMALAASYPVISVLVVVVWSVIARTVYASLRDVEERRLDRGPRSSDAFVAVLMAPLRLIPAAVTGIVTGLGGLIIAVAGMFGTAALVALARPGNADPFSEVALAAGMCIAVLVSWWGVGGTPVRRGSRAMVRAVAPGRAGALVLGVLLLSIASYLAVRTQATGMSPDWTPMERVMSTTIGGWR